MNTFCSVEAHLYRIYFAVTAWAVHINQGCEPIFNGGPVGMSSSKSRARVPNVHRQRRAEFWNRFSDLVPKVFAKPDLKTNQMRLKNLNFYLHCQS